MQTRRRFLQDIACLTAATGISGGLLSSVQRAAAIEPEPGSSFLDAEHVVILMQENRSFDHTFGMLRGVRGFNDPRTLRQADGNPIWVQATEQGEKYIPFHLDIKDTKTTWMGCLPHGWSDQVDAANKGLHDRWLQVKKSGNREYAEMPLTMGYYSREDIPFYYALADAFTVCDQNFCSTLTGTTPNRLHLWTGTSRTRQTPDSQVVVRNEDCQFGRWANWTTFPERLEEHEIPWKIYQNELTVPSGLSREANAWLGNYGDNPIEWFEQYHVRFYSKHHQHLKNQASALTQEIEGVQKQLSTSQGAEKEKQNQQLKSLKGRLSVLEAEIQKFSPENFAKLTPQQKSLHTRAFSTNSDDPFYRELEELVYQEDGQEHRLHVPKGDVLHQFRHDVENGKLPAVSWIVPAGSFSDHPSYPWYGQWYLSEVLNILTQNPEVWKKTIFILTYDENDGYYDHVPPFQAPHPKRPETGKTSDGLDTSLDFLELEQDRQYKPKSVLRDNSLGLGFRVPMVVASPWSRGGAVCSQVFDHTSVVQFLEKFASHKSGKEVRETNITDWRRAVCGDMTSAFRTAADVNPGLTEFLERDPHLEQIHYARLKKLPTGFHPLSPAELKQIQAYPENSALPRQEPGTRPACPLPYELTVEGEVSQDGQNFVLNFEAGNQFFEEASAGAAFIVYAQTPSGPVVRHYAVSPGSSVSENWPLQEFGDKPYHFSIHGPNGFYREFRGLRQTGSPKISFSAQLPAEIKAPFPCHQVGVNLDNRNSQVSVTASLKDLSYGNPPVQISVGPGEQKFLPVDIKATSGWYDFRVEIPGSAGIEKRYSGRFETGNWGTSDPAMS